MMKYVGITLLLFSLMLSSCATKGQTGLAGGAAAGAVIGQAIGRNTGGTLIGAAVGGMLGYILGNEMDKYDRDQMGYAYETTPTGQPSSWVNPDTGNEYTVTPEKTYQNPQTQQVCRSAVVEAVIDGKKQKTHTTACRDQYGDWHLQN